MAAVRNPDKSQQELFSEKELHKKKNGTQSSLKYIVEKVQITAQLPGKNKYACVIFSI